MPHLDPAFSSGSDHLVHARPDIHERMVAFEDNATGVCRYRPPRKLFRATAGSWSCVLAATLGWLGAAQFRVT